jgi:hypothetical protein
VATSSDPGAQLTCQTGLTGTGRCRVAKRSLPRPAARSDASPTHAHARSHASPVVRTFCVTACLSRVPVIGTEPPCLASAARSRVGRTSGVYELPAPQIRSVRGAGTSNTECMSCRHLKYGVHKVPAPQIRVGCGAGTSNTGARGAGTSQTGCKMYRHLKYGCMRCRHLKFGVHVVPAPQMRGTRCGVLKYGVKEGDMFRPVAEAIL